MKIIKLVLPLFLIIAFVAIQNSDANAQCKTKFSIDYVAEWSEYYDACNSEMKTSLYYDIDFPGGYKAVWAQVDNTPFSQEYWAGVVCPSYPCTGTIIDWVHCTQTTDHRLMMDIVGGVGEYLGFNEQIFSVQYYADQPD